MSSSCPHVLGNMQACQSVCAVACVCISYEGMLRADTCGDAHGAYSKACEPVVMDGGDGNDEYDMRMHVALVMMMMMDETLWMMNDV